MSTKNISILGAGKIGLALATLWSHTGHSICLASRNPEKLQTTLPVNVKSIKEAIAQNDIIVLAVPYSAIPDLIPTIAHDLEGKIVIDATNPFGISPEGHVISTLGSHITAGTYMASLLPKSIVIRAFTHVMDELLLNRGVKYPGLFAMAIAGDDHDAKVLVAELVNDTGFVPVDIGTLKESAPLDPGGILFPQFFTVADMKLTLNKNKTAGLLRRIVTSIDKNGKAIFESDKIPPVTFTMEDDWPGFNNVELWQTAEATPSLSDQYNPNKPYDFNLPPGVVRFCTMRLPPLKKLLAHQKSKGNDVDLKTFGMHSTHTIDFLILLEGEVTLLLENGEEKTLSVHDTVVQKGNIHAWHNRGETDCVIACVMIGAKDDI